MSFVTLRNAALALIGAATLGGCATYDPYYGASVGVGSRYYDPYYDRGYSPYYGGGYGNYGYGNYGNYGSRYGNYGSPYGGWYQGYYYPGTGVYVYDRQRRSYRLSNAQRRYWEQQRVLRRADPRVRENVRQYRGERRDDRRAYRVERRDDRGQLRRGEVTRQEYRADRRNDRRAYNKDQRKDRRELRRENRRDRGRKPD